MCAVWIKNKGIDYELRRKHLLALIEREGITQAKFASIIVKPDAETISAQNINAMCRGKRKITENTVRAVKDHFPDYRLAWLSGDDDDEPTQEEYDEREANAFREDFAEQHSEDALLFLAKVNRWKITHDKQGFIFCKGNIIFKLNVWGLETLRDEIAQYAEMRFRQLADYKYDINTQPHEAEE